MSELGCLIGKGLRQNNYFLYAWYRVRWVAPDFLTKYNFTWSCSSTGTVVIESMSTLIYCEYIFPILYLFVISIR